MAQTRVATFLPMVISRYAHCIKFVPKKRFMLLILLTFRFLLNSLSF